MIPNSIEQIKTPRSSMPQIDDLVHFSTYMKRIGVNCTDMKIHPLHLKASQGNFNKKKIEEIRANLETSDISPVIVSSDLYVLDGHHRWIAQGHREEMSVVKIDMGIDDLKKVALNYVGKFHKETITRAR